MLLKHVRLLPDTTVLLPPFQHRESFVLLDTFAKDRLSASSPVARAALHRTAEQQTAKHVRWERSSPWRASATARCVLRLLDGTARPDLHRQWGRCVLRGSSAVGGAPTRWRAQTSLCQSSRVLPGRTAFATLALRGLTVVRAWRAKRESPSRA